MNNDDYLGCIKQEIYQSIKEDEKIQQFLVWLHEKTASLCSPYQEAALRAFYCDLVEGIRSAPYNYSYEEGVSVNRKISRLLDSNLDKDIDEARRVGSELSNDYITYNSSKLSTIERRHLRRLIYEAETLPAVKITFDKDVAIACKLPYSYEEYKHYEPPYPKHGYLDRAIALLVRSSDRGFQGQIKYIMNTFSDARKCGDYLYEKRL